MPYKIIYHSRVKSQLSKIDAMDLFRINRSIKDRLIKEPLTYGKKLCGTLKSYWSFRVGDYRIIYKINLANELIIIEHVKHRREVYS